MRLKLIDTIKKTKKIIDEKGKFYKTEKNTTKKVKNMSEKKMNNLLVGYLIIKLPNEK